MRDCIRISSTVAVWKPHRQQPKHSLWLPTPSWQRIFHDVGGRAKLSWKNSGELNFIGGLLYSVFVVEKRTLNSEFRAGLANRFCGHVGSYSNNRNHYSMYYIFSKWMK